MSLSYRVISIGTLSKNALWNERQPKRASHATTTLIRDRNTTILVDPGLPAEILSQRLDERTGLTPEQIDLVFLTNFRPAHRRALGLFERAKWVMHEREIEAVGLHLAEIAERCESDEEVIDLVRDEQALLARIAPAPEKLTGQVHLYPAGGVTPGTAGLLLAATSRTTLVAGDAVITQGHYEAGRVFEQVADVAQARTSFAEIVEIADEIVPGHDNLFAVARR